MATDKENRLVEIFAGSSIEAEIVRGLLNNSGIEAFLKDDNMGTIAPWYVSAGGAGSVKVIVSSLDLDEAKAVVEEYNNNLKSGE
jgi:hypothetical protein